MTEHPQKILQDALLMYQGRVAIALQERESRCAAVGMFVVMEDRTSSTKIVPDMRVLCLDRNELLEKVDRSHPTVGGAISFMDRASLHSEEVPFGVLFKDGGIMATTVQVHDADRDRRD